MTARVTRVQIAQVLEIDEEFVVELERHALIESDARGTFDPRALERVRLCWTMRHTLGLNLPGVEVVLHLLERWERDRRRTHALLQELLEARGRR